MNDNITLYDAISDDSEINNTNENNNSDNNISNDNNSDNNSDNQSDDEFQIEVLNPNHAYKAHELLGKSYKNMYVILQAETTSNSNGTRLLLKCQNESCGQYIISYRTKLIENSFKCVCHKDISKQRIKAIQKQYPEILELCHKYDLQPPESLQPQPISNRDMKNNMLSITGKLKHNTDLLSTKYNDSTIELGISLNSFGKDLTNKMTEALNSSQHDEQKEYAIYADSLAKIMQAFSKTLPTKETKINTQVNNVNQTNQPQQPKKPLNRMINEQGF